MPSYQPWDVIFDAGSSRTILTLDFPDEKGREASFADLAARIGSGYSFLRAKPPISVERRQLSGDAYVGPWLEGLKRKDRPILAVLGYSVGCVYAAAIAEGISEWQQAPPLILFDPQFATMEVLSDQFDKEISATSPLLADDEIKRARNIVTDAAESESEALTHIVADMIDNYLEVITAAFERAGLGSAYGNELMAHFESFITWIAVAAQIDVSGAWQHSTTIVSSDYADLPDRAVSNGNQKLIGRSISFDVCHSDLLRSESVAQTVLGILRSY